MVSLLCVSVTHRGGADACVGGGGAHDMLLCTAPICRGVERALAWERFLVACRRGRGKTIFNTAGLILVVRWHCVVPGRVEAETETSPVPYA